MVTLICVAGAIALLPFFTAQHRTMPPWWLALLLLAVPFVAALFTVRGYRLEGDFLHIRRLYWTTCIPLTGLMSATVERDAMRRSIRLCGNGGAFSFSGWWWSRRLGRYRVWVTDLKQTVVLRFPNRTIVISPDRPEEFAHEARATVTNLGEA